jgi:hypothetical protein
LCKDLVKHVQTHVQMLWLEFDTNIMIYDVSPDS